MERLKSWINLALEARIIKWKDILNKMWGSPTSVLMEDTRFDKGKVLPMDYFTNPESEWFKRRVKETLEQ